MKHIVCDRCGRTELLGISRIKQYHISNITGEIVDNTQKDLCTSCVNDLVDIWKVVLPQEIII